ncbi:hypothetical protein K466DRAFT_595147 [Polyporus arcularius HHB13444]|uniref:Uncharacterized protein n=1 Tax=Polyporus arcularius HHB13444 TaxID=1314778 RepID=A0A5C3PT54_9APHY|nr:hypothetical protein K466DRAFT_595147 [Polyporus arcularius HHB13444]
MSYPLTNDDPRVPIGDAWTADGQRIYVYATPTPPPFPTGVDAMTTPTNAAEPGTPMVIEDTLDARAIALTLREMRDEAALNVASTQAGQPLQNEGGSTAVLAPAVLQPTPQQANTLPATAALDAQDAQGTQNVQNTHDTQDAQAAQHAHDAQNTYATQHAHTAQNVDGAQGTHAGQNTHADALNTQNTQNAQNALAAQNAPIAQPAQNAGPHVPIIQPVAQHPPAIPPALQLAPALQAIAPQGPAAMAGAMQVYVDTPANIAQVAHGGAQLHVPPNVLAPITLHAPAIHGTQGDAGELDISLLEQNATLGFDMAVSSRFNASIPPPSTPSCVRTTHAHTLALRPRPYNSNISDNVRKQTPAFRNHELQRPFAAELSEWGRTPSRTAATGLSHMSYDWYTPTPRGPRYEANAANIVSTNAQAEHAQNADAHPAGGNNANVAAAATQAQTAQRTGNERCAMDLASQSTDYFALFPTPPPFADRAGSDTAQPLDLRYAHPAAHEAEVATSIADTNEIAGSYAFNSGPAPSSVTTADDATQERVIRGKLSHNPASIDDAPNARKRLWTGSPNPEDTRRSLRRPRRIGPARTPATAGNVSNPWRAESGGTGTVWNGSSGAFGMFAPVAVSTPLPRPVINHDNRTLEGHQSAARDAAPPLPAATLQESARLTPMNAVYGQETSGQAAGPQPDLRMPDVDDMLEYRPASPLRNPSNRDKGKRRATSQDDESSAAEQAQLGPEEDEWDDAELLEARARSLRQSHARRRGDGYADAGQAAGPSRRADEREHTHDHTERHESHRRGGRDDQPSHEPRRTATHSRHADRHARAYNQHEHSLRPRERSEFLPLPNTRAAEYIANARPERSMQTPPLTQRRPPPRTRSPSRHTPRATTAPSQPTHATSGDLQMDDDWTRNVEEREAEEASDDEDEDVGADFEADGWREEGEIIPSALHADAATEEDWPTDPPRGGFPRIYRDDPESTTRGMATDWIREVWADPPNSVVLVDVYNYRYSEDDEYNRRVADQLRTAFERITGEHDFDVVPPEPADGMSRRTRDRPTIWAIRGLTARSVARAVARGTWSSRAISFMAFPRALTIPSWLFMLEGFLTDNADKIRVAILRVLREEGIAAWIADMASRNPDFEGLSAEEAVNEVLDSLYIDTFQLSNGNHVANIHIPRSPTRSMREWRRWVAMLRARRYPSFAIGTGRVRYIAPCSGCRSVNHLTHLCPFPRIRGWNGPAPGEGVFGERRRDDEENDPSVAYGRWNDGQTRERSDRLDNRDRGGRRDGGHQNARRGGPGPYTNTNANRNQRRRSPNANSRPPHHPNQGGFPDARRGKGPGRSGGGKRKN